MDESYKSNADTSGRYHTDWLNMMYPRLKIAKNFLRDDGVILISIDDHEQDNLKKICNEIFGEENFIESYIWESTFRPDNSSSIFRKNAEFVLAYAKNIKNIDRLIGSIEKSEGLPSLTKNSMKESVLRFNANEVSTFLSDGKYKSGTKDTGYELLNDVFVEDGKIVTDFSLKGRVIWGQEYLERQIKSGTEIIIKGENFVPYSKKSTVVPIAPNKIIPNTLVKDVLSGRAQVKQLFEGISVFSYPKPTSLLRYLIDMIDDKEMIVMDFFAGSSTTAAATMELNAGDEGRRKYIMIQLPEDTAEGSETYKAGYKNICEIGKERIRRAGKKIVEENQDKEGIEDLDIGFKVFKLDETNLKIWDEETNDLHAELWGQVEPLKEGRTHEDVVYEILLKYGIDLTVPIEEKQLNGKTVFSVGMDYLLICLERDLTLEFIEEMLNQYPDCRRVVFYDEGFKNDTDRVNAEQLLKRYGIEDIRVI